MNMELVDVCLFVYWETFDAPTIMGGKIYDYIASGKPLWLLIPNNAYSILSFANKTSKPIVSDIYDPDSIKQKLELIIELYKQNKLQDYGFEEKEVQIYSREYQYRKILDILS